MSQPPGNQPPPRSENEPAPGAAAAGGSWPPVPPTVANRLVSSVTAVPFTPETGRTDSTAPMFSCIVEPPARKPRQKNAPESAEETDSAKTRQVRPTTTPARNANVTPTQPSAAPFKQSSATAPAQPAAASSGTTAPMGTMPPFGMGASSAPFASGGASSAPFAQGVPLGADGKFEFNPEKPQGTRWLSWSTLVFLLACAGGYWKYRQMQAEPPPPPKPQPVANANTEAVKPASSGGIATPFSALKQAKATIKDAGDKHKAAYDMVERMLDDPNAAVDATPKPAAPAVVVEAPPAAAPAKNTRDFATVQLGTDGEFVVPADSPRPSANFVRWIKNAKIGGVRLTDRPRVLIGPNGYTFGDVVELNLGITLEGYNAETRSLRFKETSGAVIERRI